MIVGNDGFNGGGISLVWRKSFKRIYSRLSEVYPSQRRITRGLMPME
ncbi:hypothetical protein A2U01_0100063, partial [Trifolium medium]|nr:hypothetical protein [Trifolium medium]